ncbi:MAG: triphosphoribosyl-dephospho-CoA synthase [Bacilli bacterium]|jgi:holo-ACP synthase CitX|nr:triphosphoribosyl-dephospho-CoA synthase [Bacilli bacterium]
MKQTNLILEDREKRIDYIKTIIDKGFGAITLRANIPGSEKRIPVAYLLVQYYGAILNRLLSRKPLIIDGFDGPTYIYQVDAEQDYKPQMMEIEEATPLGRFIDIDVYQNSYFSKTRKLLRKCYLCDNPAFVCNKKQTHPYGELINVIEENVYSEIQKNITNMVKTSMMLELDIHPKFGLVTPYSQGSHPDMDYNLMIKAQAAIMPYLVEMFFKGLKGNDVIKLFKECREIGKLAEESMLKVTGNINAYKGLIFSLGLTLASSGYVISRHLSFPSVFSTIKAMTVDLMQELSTPPESFGVLAYQRYGLGGARYEAAQGYLLVQNNLASQEISFEPASLTMLLIKIIRDCQDTVLLKRAGSMERYQYFKQLVTSIKEYDLEKITEVTNFCIENNISFGGSADLLIVTIFLKLLKQTFYLH